MDCISDLLWFPKVSGTSVYGPSLPRRVMEAFPVQCAAGISFDLVQDSFWFHLCAHHKVNVSGAHVRRQERPAALSAMLPQCLQHRFPLGMIQFVQWLLHLLFLRQNSPGTGRNHRSAELIVLLIHRSRFIAMQACAVAREGNQIGQRDRHRQCPTESEPRTARERAKP